MGNNIGDSSDVHLYQIGKVLHVHFLCMGNIIEDQSPFSLLMCDMNIQWCQVCAHKRYNIFIYDGSSQNSFFKFHIYS